jgi:hypothetical protein
VTFQERKHRRRVASPVKKLCRHAVVATAMGEMMSRIDDLLKLLGSTYTHGYGPARIPSAIDDEASELLAAIMELNETDRRATVAGMSEDHGSVMVALAMRAASRAVRIRQPKLITQGLSALAIASWLVDYREVLRILSLLYCSSRKLGLNSESIFVRSNVGTDDFGDAVEYFPHRTEANASIEAMFFCEGEDQDGFRYVYRGWRPTTKDIE